MTLDLAAIRALCEAATPGPWRHKRSRDEDADWEDEVIAQEGPVGYSPVCEGSHARDAAFIAASRTLVPQMLAEIERLQARQQELLATIVRVTNETPFPDEIKGWESQRAALIAEVGSLRTALRMQLDEHDETRKRAREDRAELVAELARIRPVYEAAKEFVIRAKEGHHAAIEWRKLKRAVEAQECGNG